MTGEAAPDMTSEALEAMLSHPRHLERSGEATQPKDLDVSAALDMTGEAVAMTCEAPE